MMFSSFNPKKAAKYYINSLEMMKLIHLTIVYMFDNNRMMS